MAITLIIWPKLVYPMTLRFRVYIHYVILYVILSSVDAVFFALNFLTEFVTSNLTYVHYTLLESTKRGDFYGIQIIAKFFEEKNKILFISRHRF